MCVKMGWEGQKKRCGVVGGKRRDKKEGRQEEEEGTEGYLRDVSQNVGEEKTDRRVDREM